MLVVHTRLLQQLVDLINIEKNVTEKFFGNKKNVTDSLYGDFP